VKSKFKKILLSLVLLYSSVFPNNDLIVNHKSLKEMEEDGEIHLGI